MPMFNFVWEEYNVNSGVIESVCTQCIYGENLVEAVDYFNSFHGELTPDENGIAIRITKMEYDELETKLRTPWESDDYFVDDYAD